MKNKIEREQITSLKVALCIYESKIVIFGPDNQSTDKNRLKMINDAHFHTRTSYVQYYTYHTRIHFDSRRKNKNNGQTNSCQDKSPFS